MTTASARWRPTARGSRRVLSTPLWSARPRSQPLTCALSPMLCSQVKGPPRSPSHGWSGTAIVALHPGRVHNQHQGWLPERGRETGSIASGTPPLGGAGTGGEGRGGLGARPLGTHPKSRGPCRTHPFLELVSLRLLVSPSQRFSLSLPTSNVQIPVL